MLEIRRTEEGKAAPLTRRKQYTQQLVNEYVGEIRSLFATPIVAQDLTYSEKAAQAEKFLAQESEPVATNADDLSEYGFIFGEVGITADTPFQVATIILYKRDIMRSVGPQIERLRLKAGADIEAATTLSAVGMAWVEFYEDMTELKALL